MDRVRRKNVTLAIFTCRWKRMKRPSSKRGVGWDGASAINQSPQQCSFEQAVLACREEYQVELSLGRLKGEPLSLPPMYLHHDESASRLIQMLSLGARPDLAGRRRPKKTGPQRRNTEGVICWQTNLRTAGPTTELMRPAFK